MNWGSLCVMLIVSLLVKQSIGETQLSCATCTTTYTTLWPTFKYCQFSSVNLSNIEENYIFSCKDSDIQDASVVRFHSATDTINHIPLEIFDNFPNITGLWISSSKILNVKNNLFGNPSFEKIHYLLLESNQIENIEENAFQYMKNLKWLRIYNNNKLGSLDLNIFKNNSNLDYLDLRSNGIKSVIPSLFANLKNLKYFQFESNTCLSLASGTADLSAAPLDSKTLNENFKTCYANYINTKGFQIHIDEIEQLKMQKENLTKFINELKQIHQDYAIKADNETDEIKRNFNGAIEEIRINLLASLKVLLAGINYNVKDAKEIKRDIKKIPQGKTDMKTYEQAVKENFVERAKEFEGKLNGYLKEIVKGV